MSLTKRKAFSVFIIILFLFCGSTKTIFAQQKATETGETTTREFSVLSGWAFGDLKRQDDYKMVPLYVQFGFDIKPLLKKIHIDPPGATSFILEPFLNGVISPDSNVETGLNFNLKYRHPLTQNLHVFIEGGLGLLYTTQHVSEQGMQFNFNEFYGAGVSYFFAEDKSFNVGYRYRHFSNLDIEEPNAGVDMKMVLAGITIYY